MGDDLLGDILRNTLSGNAAPRPAKADMGDLLARVAASDQGGKPATRLPPDLSSILELSADDVRWILRRQPDDDLLPLLDGAPAPIQQALIAGLDAEQRAWVRQQSSASEVIPPARHAAAAAKALTLVARLRQGPAQPAAEPPASSAPILAPDPTVVPVAVMPPTASVQSQVSSRTVAAIPASSNGDEELTSRLTQLVAIAQRLPAGALAANLDGSDHPALAAGLRSLAAGGDAHAVAAAVRAAGDEILLREQQRIELILRAVLAIRFGEGREGFLASVRDRV